MSLITENNRQYYEGAQNFKGNGSTVDFTTTFNTNLEWFAASNSDIDYARNNFKLYTSTSGLSGSWTEVLSGYTVSGNTITFGTAPIYDLNIVVQLKSLDGGNYGTSFQDKAFGDVVEKNYGSYSYVKLNDIINNFLVAYVGAGKLIPSVKKTDLIFHAKRALQEFSYDTLKSINSQELTIPNNLSVPFPQDYVNYVSVHWVDDQGVKHIIMPTTLTSNPYKNFVQDSNGVPIQDNLDNNIEGTSITEERWATNNLVTREQYIDSTEFGWDFYYGENSYKSGKIYGLDRKIQISTVILQ